MRCLACILFVFTTTCGNAAAFSVNSPQIAIYGDGDRMDFGLGTSPTYVLPNSSLTWPGPPNNSSTSYLVINVDGIVVSFNDDLSNAVVQPFAAFGSGLGGFLEGSKTIAGTAITVLAHYEIVLNPQTGSIADTMKTKITLTNQGAASHQVGVRLEIDTMVNGVDGANISLNNGVSVIAIGMTFRKGLGSLPGDWWDYDIPPPAIANLVGRGVVWGNPFDEAATIPDVFEVAKWADVQGQTTWITAPASGITDSSVVYWWTGTGSETGLSQLLLPGQNISFVTYYGLNQGTLLSTFTPTRTIAPTLVTTPTPTVTVSPTLVPTPSPLLLHLLSPNPNPSPGPAIWFGYWLTADSEVTIRIYTVSGEKVINLPPFQAYTGYNEELWNLQNETGSSVASGVYVYRVTARSKRGEEESIFSKCAIAR